MSPADLVVDVRGAVIRRERILLIREKGGERVWSLPGGEADPGRAYSDFLREKILIETGVHVDVIRAIHVSDEVGSHPRTLRITYLCAPLSGKLTPGGTVKEVRWVEVSRATRLPLSDHARGVIGSLTDRFTLVIRNRDIRRILIGVPRGHMHKRVILELTNGLIVLHEATVENLVRAFVEIEMHPCKRAIMLEGRVIEVRKEGYSSYQLLEADVDDSDVERIMSEMLGVKASGSDQDLKEPRT
ncbi:MAG: NUDIX domain-containing protein [Candidatus Korarchaeum sp.]